MGDWGIAMNNEEQSVLGNASEAPEFRVAIIGGGPGGLFTAWHLADRIGAACKVTIYEATDRLGGKIVTGEFPGIGLYEAGAAEIYDYSELGYDPLRELIEQDLGLEIKHIDGDACVLDGHILPDIDALGSQFGMTTRDVAHAFRQRCASLLSHAAFYRSDLGLDNRHPWAELSAAEILATEIKDETARRYIRVMAHSDVSVPPHLTNGLTFLKNVLMDVDGYLSIYSVVGGNQRIVDRLEEELDADVQLNTTVRSVEPQRDGSYRLEVTAGGVRETVVADYVVLALPLTALSMIDWRSAALRRAMDKHIGHFDRPGHYLRATLLFERPFWREHVSGNWFMIDGFDGCCVYDESSRHELGRNGALSFLIAGNAALSLANMSDDRIEQLCLDALPPVMQHGRELLIDRRINRWMATVNAVPGGLPQRGRLDNHRPDPDRLPGLMTVGDYMFDATLNGVLDSADTVTDLILSDVIFRRRALTRQCSAASEADGVRAACDNELVRGVFEGSLLADLLSIAYGVRRGGRILSVGPGAAAMVAALRAQGFEAWGFDGTPHGRAHDSHPAQSHARNHNLVGDMADLPFRDGAFDVVIERGLCYLPRDRVTKAVAELRRVTRRGVVLGSVTTDLAIDLLERYDLVAGVATLSSRWDWSDLMFAHGFDHALSDPARLDRAWKRAEEAGAGLGHWYEDAHALLYCIYQVADAAAERREPAEVISLPRRDLCSQDLGSRDMGSRDMGGRDMGGRDDRAPVFASRAAV
jgi:protoporphyrinogen oxidase/SAM-dependent methyltransferase